MKIKFTSIFLLFLASLTPLLLVSCNPTIAISIETPKPSPTFELPTTPTPGTDTPSPVPTTPTPICSGTNLRCPADSLTLTAEMGATLDAIPSNTPPPWATVLPSAGDLGWGSVYGTITDGVTGLPLEGATVKCEHFSYTSQYLCDSITATNSDGIYAFGEVHFLDTDRIVLFVEAPGYVPLRFEQDTFTRAEFHADLGLFPVDYGSESPTPFLMCTPPPCLDGVLTCGASNGCVGGCGTICLPLTPTP